jgi:hypothetical protein
MKQYTPQRCGVSLLDRLDAVVSKLPLSTPDEQFEEKVLEDMLSAVGREQRHDVAIKLGNLMRKRRAQDEGRATKQLIPAAQQWAKILSRVDDIYLVAAEMLPVFTYALRRLITDMAREDESEKRMGSDSFSIGEIKDPVRIHEKALDEYGARFADAELPEACVTDVLRARVACRTGTQINTLVSLLQGGVRQEVADESHLGLLKEGVLDGGARKVDEETGFVMPKKAWKAIDPETGEEEGDVVRMTLMGMVNRFADLDPTHFRLAICTVQLSFRGVVMYVEIEVHYDDIMRIALAESGSAYSHYNFFRQRLAGTVPESELDLLLEEKLVFLVDATGIPVLLSLLVLIFTSGGEDLTKLPSNRIELYELGIDSAI